MSTPTKSAKKPAWKPKAGQMTVSRATKNAFDYMVASKELLTWFGALLNQPVGGENDTLDTVLKDGIILCKVMNVLKPGALGRIQDKKTPFAARDNLGQFLDAAKAFGISDVELFKVNDLYEEQNLLLVAACLKCLAAQAKKQGFSGPQLKELTVEEWPSFSQKDLLAMAKKMNVLSVNQVQAEAAEAAAADTAAQTAKQSATPAKAEAAPKPAAEAPKPVAEAPKPAAEAPKPAAEAPKPAAEAPKPAAEAPKPAAEAPKPAAEAPKPAAEAPKPAAEAPKPAAEAPKAASEAVAAPGGLEEPEMKQFLVEPEVAEFVMVEVAAKGTGRPGKYVVMPLWLVQKEENEYKLKGLKKHH